MNDIMSHRRSFKKSIFAIFSAKILGFFPPAGEKRYVMQLHHQSFIDLYSF